MLTADQRDEFRATGLLRLTGAFSRPLRRRCATGCGNSSPASTGFIAMSPRRGPSSSRPACSALASGRVPDGGVGRWSPSRKTARGNCLSAHGTSTACPCRPDRPVQFVGFLNQVRPRGGGTLVLTGSHRLVAPYPSLGEAFRLDRVRTSLASHPWLRGLWMSAAAGDRVQRYMNDGTIIDAYRSASWS